MNEHVDLLSTEATNTVACNEEATNEVVEEWRPVVGYEGIYEVGNLGHVRNIKTAGILKPILNKYGYCVVNLYKDKCEGKSRRITQYRLHKLVALSFLGQPEAGLQLDHIDGDKTNNKVSNLRWVTSKENHNNPITLARKRSISAHLKYQRCNTEKRGVYCPELDKVWVSQKQAAADLGVSQASISALCNHKSSGKFGLYSKALDRRLHFVFID